MRITRYYCPTAHETVSLLPDCLASRFPSDIDDVERVVIHVEAARSVAAAADALRPDRVLPFAIRWVRRRLRLVRAGRRLHLPDFVLRLLQFVSLGGRSGLPLTARFEALGSSLFARPCRRPLYRAVDMFEPGSNRDWRCGQTASCANSFLTHRACWTIGRNRCSLASARHRRKHCSR
jgi:hypothetical protein